MPVLEPASASVPLAAVMRYRWPREQVPVLAHLKRAEPHAEECRDATWTAPSFRLRLIDCWNALSKGMAGGWVDLPPSPDDYRCGAVDIDEYDHYDCPLNGDMHEVVPGRFIAFRGPVDLGGGGGGDCYRDDGRGGREFGPDFYAGIFAEDFGVAAAVLLNEARYDRRRLDGPPRPGVRGLHGNRFEAGRQRGAGRAGGEALRGWGGRGR